MYSKDELLTKAAGIKPWLVEIRRDLHRHPELGMEEYRTRDKIIEYLTEMGIPFERDIAHTGVVGFIEGGIEGKTIALRADIDALPITEMNEVDYKSQNVGKMHACGHDAHTTVLLGAAKLLNDNKENLKGNVKLFFQPAEETVGGAKPMIEAGVMENPKVEAVFGLHIAPDIPVGEIGVKYDQMNAASNSLSITIKGDSAHGATPHNGTDAILIAAKVISALQTIVSRNVDPRDSAVISIGVIQGGTAANIIADTVTLTGTVRTLHPDVRSYVLKRIEEVVSHTTQAMGGTFTLTIKDGYNVLINDNSMVDIVKQSAIELIGEENVHQLQLPSLGVEDFAFFAEAAPSAFYRLGGRNEERGIVHGLHTNQFDIDEDCLPLGAALQALTVYKYLNEKK
ncbi:M20 metallopeptidase family protein [Sporosarcina sp. FA9]|uniref:M20 metallopeptidase family protein n=1 Tax=Sporosarcina sp. FA9 TaxID=3413030 RepID=UPI003F659BEA